MRDDDKRCARRRCAGCGGGGGGGSSMPYCVRGAWRGEAQGQYKYAPVGFGRGPAARQLGLSQGPRAIWPKRLACLGQILNWALPNAAHRMLDKQDTLDWTTNNVQCIGMLCQEAALSCPIKSRTKKWTWFDLSA